MSSTVIYNKSNPSREVIRDWFLEDFFRDHCKTYQKALSTGFLIVVNGKQNGFKALVRLYCHNADAIGDLRADYLYRI